MVTLSRRPVAARIKYDDLKTEEELVTWWYGGICRKSGMSSEPKVLVSFRKVLSDGQFGDYIRRRVPITALGQFRIGSIWKNCVKFEELKFEEKLFTVDFSEGGWKFHSAAEDKPDNSPELIPESVYPLQTDHTQTWMIKFSAIDEKGSSISLVVPCMEFFSRCYGRSQYIKRVLCSYSWEEVENKFFYPLPTSPNDDKWYICPHSQTIIGDSVFLAHAKYDSYTARKAKSVWSQINAAFSNKATEFAYPTIAPWFKEPGQLSVSGIWIEKGKSFLALRVDGSTEPDGKIITRVQGSYDKEQLGSDDDAFDGQGKTPSAGIIKTPPIVHVTGGMDPSSDTGTVIIKEEPFKTLGAPRRVNRVKYDAGQKIYVIDYGHEDEPEVFSGGEPHGKGSGVGNVKYESDQIMESQGKLRDVWNALHRLHEEHSDVVGQPEFFTSKTGFSNEKDPTLLSYQVFNKSEKGLAPSVRLWPYYSIAEKRMRGALLAKIKIRNETIYFFEIQRRVNVIEDGSDNKTIKEESYSGLVFKLEDDGKIEEWIEKIMDLSRHTKGILANIIPKCPGIAQTYKHCTAKHESFQCESAVRNALKKMGITRFN